ncbi:MAG: sigma-70 family RNA polymerase sigma factor [Mangrovibacterium sp.]
MAKQENIKILLHDKKSYEKLFAEYHSDMLAFAQNILFSEDEAKDVVQDVFLDLWKQEKDIEIETTMKTMLFTYVKKRAFNRIQHLNIVDKHELQLKEAYLAAYTKKTNDRTISPEIQKILDGFPQQMRKIVEYRYLCGWSCQDIAEVMNIKVNTVKTQVARALKKFRMATTQVRGYNLPCLIFILFHLLSSSW